MPRILLIGLDILFRYLSFISKVDQGYARIPNYNLILLSYFFPIRVISLLHPPEFAYICLDNVSEDNVLAKCNWKLSLIEISV